MTGRIDALLDRLDARLLLIAFVCLFVMTLLASYLYLFKVPMGQYKRLDLQIEKSRNYRDSQKSNDVFNVLQATAGEVTSLHDRLYGGAENVPENEMVPFIIGRLDRLSEGQNVQLRSVTPRASQRVLMFEEIAFDISVTGNYLDIIKWLRKVEDELHPMVVKQFKMAGFNGGLQTNLRIVSYRPSARPL